MTTVGIIGSGMIGGTVARLSVAAGYHVVLSNSRGPETLAELVAELGPLATAGTSEQAGEAGDLVLVSIPVKAFGDVPVKPLAGKPVLDTGNYYPGRDGQIAELDTGALTSSGLLQRYLPEAHVVKVFNNIFFKHLHYLARPHGAQDRSALPIAGDDAGRESGRDRVPRLDRLRRRRHRPARRELAPGTGHPRLRQPVRPILRRDGHARQRRDHPRRPGRRPPLGSRPGSGPQGSHQPLASHGRGGPTRWVRQRNGSCR